MQQLLEKLCMAIGVSGDENDALDTAEQLLSPLGEIEHTASHSIICRLPAADEKLPHVMLTAHIDRIGLMVTQITDKGFIKTASCGGVDRRSVSGARVTVHAEDKKIKGVVIATPPHLSDGKSLPPKTDGMTVDVGLTKDKAKELISLGDRITFDAPFTNLLGDRVCAPALDDRSGCAAVIRAAQLLRDCGKARVSVALTSQEESGSAGAKTSAFILKPDYAFAVDVSFAMTPDSDAEDCAELGKGPMVGIAPILDRKLSKLLIDVAKRRNIPYQTEIMAGSTGTDADHIAVSGVGVKTAVISIPLRFMHTAGEVVSLADIENTAKLIAETVGGGLC